MTIGHRHAVPGPDEHGHVRRHVPECDRALCSAAKAGSDLGEPRRLRDPSRHELDEITASVDGLEEAVPRATYCGGKFVDRQSIMIEERLHDGLPTGRPRPPDEAVRAPMAMASLPDRGSRRLCPPGRPRH